MKMSSGICWEVLAASIIRTLMMEASSTYTAQRLRRQSSKYLSVSTETVMRSAGFDSRTSWSQRTQVLFISPPPQYYVIFSALEIIVGVV
jgi:hypothetical protein